MNRPPSAARKGGGGKSKKENRWSADLWSDSSPNAVTAKLLKLLGNSGVKAKSTFRSSRKRAHTINYSPSNRQLSILHSLSEECVQLKAKLSNRCKLVFVSRKEKDDAINDLLDCGTRICQYLLLNAREVSRREESVAIYDLILCLLSRQEFDHIHVHSTSEPRGGTTKKRQNYVLNSVGEMYFQFALNTLKVAVNNCYWGDDVCCAFSGKVFAKLVWRFPILGGYIVDSFPTDHLKRLLRNYKRSTYSHYYDSIEWRELNVDDKRKDSAEYLKAKRGNTTQMEKFIHDYPDFFAWASSVRYAPLTKIIFDQIHDYSTRNNRRNLWNHKLKANSIFAFSFCNTFVRHVKTIYDYRSSSRQYKDTHIVWNQLPLYPFLADYLCLLLRDYLRFFKKCVHCCYSDILTEGLEGESFGAYGQNSNPRFRSVNFDALFHKLKETEDREYFCKVYINGGEGRARVLSPGKVVPKIPPVQYDKKFETLLLESCAVFAKNDPNAAFAVVTILMMHFDCSGYVALEFYYDTLMLMLQSMDNQTVGKLVNSNTFKDLIRRLITARSISVVCHGIAIVFQTRQKLEFQARLKFTRWYLSEHFCFLFLHWSSLVRQFFYHYLLHGIFTVQRKYLSLSTDGFILRNEHLNYFKQRRARNMVGGEGTNQGNTSKEMSTTVKKIEILQSIAPYDLSICSLIDTFVHIILSAHYEMLHLDYKRTELSARDDEFMREVDAGVDISMFVTSKQMEYAKTGLQEYETCLRNCYDHENKHAQINTYQAPKPLPLRIQHIRGLLHH
eukprot:g86.t1